MGKLVQLQTKVIHRNEPIVIQRTSYSDSLLGCFFRSKQGLLIFVNENISKPDQNKVIEIIKEKTDECKTADLGIVKKGFKYRCGGSCCKYKGDDSIECCSVCPIFKRQSKTGINRCATPSD